MTDILPVSYALMGIDVSHYQGVIDWLKVANSAGSPLVDFVFIKATDGINADPMLLRNLNGAISAGIPFGFYHFWRPQHPWKDQAGNFLHVITDASAKSIDSKQVEFSAALDIETGALPEERQQDALDWLATVAETIPKPQPPLVYCSPSYAQVNLTDPAWLSFPLWVAHYTTQSQPNIGKWPKWTFWQRQGNAKIDGIDALVDIDWFNGSIEDLKAMGSSVVVPPPSVT